MLCFRTCTVLALVACAQGAVDVSVVSQAELTVRLQDHASGGLNVIVTRKNTTSVVAWIGRNAGTAISTVQEALERTVSFPNSTTLHITTRQIEVPNKGLVINLEWKASTTERLIDCVQLGANHWYGGPQQKRQLWPIERLVLREYSYVTKELDNCGIAEPYWLSSDGIYYFFDKKDPLFVDQHIIEQNNTCFISQVKAPYSNKRDRLEMAYVIGIFDNVREAHEHAVATVLGKPTGYPDEKMITYPIWSTWALYKSAINHDIVLEMSNLIVNNGFANGQFEIDDLWEICYGSLTVDATRFPNFASTVSTLKSRGFRVTMWMHPFVNKGCEPWYTDALNDGYLVLSESGSEVTSWWNDNGTTAAYVDYTKPSARKWYVDRVKLIRDTYGVDSFKFDAGETSWSPQIPVLISDVDGQPSAITTEYVKAVSTLGPLVEVRSGAGTQDLPIFVRMIDKDSYWDWENGLATLITTLLQMNLNGYTLVLPDMIGGNGYNNTTPNKELFIRWMQANVFMPSMQFSYVPWDYDAETVQISQQCVALHAQHAPDIIKAMQRSVAEGAPVNAPLWWIAPTDETTYAIWDEFLLGEDIIAAPVVTQGATSRDIYLPAGRWMEFGNSSIVHEGPVWIGSFPAPLSVLPYFIREPTPVSAASTAYISTILVLLGFVINVFNNIY